jgi:hypothetical protein
VPTLHVTNGDCAADVLRTFLTDPVAIQADVLHEGPAPAVNDDAWLEVRARFLAWDGRNYSRIRNGLAASDQMLDQDGQFERVVLWFEHDLFDQLQIVRTLSRLGRRKDAPNRTSLICIDRFPGVEPFYGLGQLNAQQLSSLENTAQPVTPNQFEIASQVWNAFRASNPSELNRLWHTDAGAFGALPFLHQAIGRFLAEYPSTKNGLSTTCSGAIEELAASPLDAGELFRRVQSRERRPFMGDSSFFGRLHRLATARQPLITIEPSANNGDLRGRVVALTSNGRAALNGELDAVAQNGIDEWRGGVHLQGSAQSPWRWDAVRETLVSWNQ